MATRAMIEEFLGQQHLAFVGASRNPKQFANAVYRKLRDGGRTMLPVHQHADQIEGDQAYSTVFDLPDPVDGVIIMLRSDAALPVVHQCIARGVPRIWLHRGAGPSAVSLEAVEDCERAGVTVIDGACPMMFAEPVGIGHKIHRWFTGRRFDEPLAMSGDR